MAKIYPFYDQKLPKIYFPKHTTQKKRTPSGAISMVLILYSGQLSSSHKLSEIVLNFTPKFIIVWPIFRLSYVLKLYIILSQI